MVRVQVRHVANAKVVTWVRRLRVATITGLFGLIAGFAWLLAAAPPFVAFGLAVTSAVAWCIWLEKHPEAHTTAGWSRQGGKEGHGCHQKAIELLGIGSENVRTVEHDDRWRMRPLELAAKIEQDRRDGLTPVAVIASAGTVNTGVGALTSIQSIRPSLSDCNSEGKRSSRARL